MTGSARPVPEEERCVPDWAVLFASICILLGFELILAVGGIALLGLPVLWTALGLAGVALIVIGAMVAGEAQKAHSADSSGG